MTVNTLNKRTVSLNWLTASGGLVNAFNGVNEIIPIGNTATTNRNPNWTSSTTSIQSNHPYISNTDETYEIKSIVK